MKFQQNTVNRKGYNLSLYILKKHVFAKSVLKIIGFPCNILIRDQIVQWMMRKFVENTILFLSNLVIIYESLKIFFICVHNFLFLDDDHNGWAHSAIYIWSPTISHPIFAHPLLLIFSLCTGPRARGPGGSSSIQISNLEVGGGGGQVPANKMCAGPYRANKNVRNV